MVGDVEVGRLSYVLQTRRDMDPQVDGLTGNVSDPLLDFDFRLTDAPKDGVGRNGINQNHGVPALGPGTWNDDAVVSKPCHRAAYALTR